MTRQEAQKICLDMLEEEMRKNNKTLDDIFLLSPNRGKDSWTYKEFKQAVLDDKPLEGMETNDTPIDDILKFEKWKKAQK